MRLAISPRIENVSSESSMSMASNSPSFVPEGEGIQVLFFIHLFFRVDYIGGVVIVRFTFNREFIQFYLELIKVCL